MKNILGKVSALAVASLFAVGRFAGSVGAAGVSSYDRERAADIQSAELRKYKKRVQDRHQSNESIRFSHIEDLTEEDLQNENENSIDISIDRRKKFSIKPMSPEEAVLQMDLLGHDFYMFTNAQTDDISIVYKRKNGGYGIIEQE